MNDQARRSENGASEVAVALATLVPALPEATAEHLRILLAQDLALRSRAELRHARLGLLIDLVSDGTGLVPAVDDYERARAERAAAGEEWPHASTLSRVYGHWSAAVGAAMALLERPTGATPGQAVRPGPPYTRDEILRAICTCRQVLGYWPAPWELSEYGRLRREQARVAGRPDPRIPQRSTVLKHFGTWESALREAARWSVRQTDC